MFALDIIVIIMWLIDVFMLVIPVIYTMEINEIMYKFNVATTTTTGIVNDKYYKKTNNSK